MDASHASTSGSAADDWETRLRIMNENLTFSERLEYLDDPDWTAFISASDRCRPSPIESEVLIGYPQIDLPILEDGELRALIHDDMSVRQESHHSTASHTTSQDSDGNEVSTFQCADCPKQYKRKTDLRRHARSHDPQGRLDCSISTCKFRGRKGNHRRDKYINHLLKGHPEVETWPCLKEGCSKAFDNVLLLGVHLDSHNSESLGSSIVKAHSITKTKCLIERCGKPLTPNHLFEHHTQVERQAEADILNALGFDHQQSALLCPACDEKFLCGIEDQVWIKEDLSKLREHVCEKHLGYAYGHQVPARHVEDSQHLLSMWKDPDTYYHCREQLLRLNDWCMFHAIFDDIRR